MLLSLLAIFWQNCKEVFWFRLGNGKNSNSGPILVQISSSSLSKRKNWTADALLEELVRGPFFFQVCAPHLKQRGFVKILTHSFTCFED